MKKNEIFTVENAKVAKVGYNFYSVGRKGYIKDVDGIVFVEVESLTFNLKTREVVSVLVDTNGKQYTRTGRYDMFESVKNYEVPSVMCANHSNTAELVKSADGRLRGCQWILTDESTDDEPSYGYIEVWTFENGEPVATPVVVKSITIDKPNNITLLDGALPEHFWESKEDAFSFNSYTVTDEDGEEFTEDGYNKRLALTEEQLAAVNALTAAFKKAEEVGVRFVWDREYCDFVKAYNGNDVDCISYEDDDRCENGQLIPLHKAFKFNTEICFYEYFSSEDYNFAMKQTPREQKAWKKEHPDEK